MNYPVKKIKLGPFNSSNVEQRDLLKAWVSISLAFAILLGDFNLFKPDMLELFKSFAIAGITVGVGFIVHELAHKIVAQKYGCYAEFRAFDKFLILAILLALFLKVIIAIPGAVMISGPVGKRRNGKISLAGPLSNLVVALAFLIPSLYFSIDMATIPGQIMFYGFFINSLLAAFNMIPFAMFDGKKIFNWNKVVWAIMAIISALFMTISIIWLGIVF